MSSFSLVEGAPADLIGGAPIPEIPFSKFRLANGLTLIVHEDFSAPLVATQLRFNVGSKDEPPGYSGFAHLFEHLLFKESANRQGNWFRTIEGLGGTQVNGTTSTDRTNYYQTVPLAALDTVLWMESDRMGHLLPAVTPEKLAEELSVVKNEKRQREGEPYGRVFETITTALYPREHPYGHTVLGSFEDLEGADIDRVAEWFHGWYGASNALLVMAGAITGADALARVEHWFGDLPPGQPVRRATQWLPPRSLAQRIVLQDRAPQGRLYKVWNTPALGEADSVDLGMLAHALAGRGNARLNRRLVDTERLCTAVDAGQHARLLCGEFHVMASLVPGADPVAVERAIDEELTELLVDGPSPAEIMRAKVADRAALIRRLETLHGRADLLAGNEMSLGSPDAHRALMAMSESATPERIAETACRWLGRPALTLEVQPFAASAGSVAAPYRAKAPGLGTVVMPSFPATERAQLVSGVNVQLVPRPGSGTINLALVLEDGTISDRPGQEGLSHMTLALLDGGTLRRDKRAIAEIFGDFAIRYSTSPGAEVSALHMSVLPEMLGVAVDMLAELAVAPAYPEAELAMMRERRLVALEAKRAKPESAASRVAGRLAYGPSHAHGRFGDGTAQSLAAIDASALFARHGTLLSPSRATLIAVGDITMADFLRHLEHAFGDWSSSGTAAAPDAGPFAPQPGRFLIAKPGAAQSALRVTLADPTFQAGRAAFSLFNWIFGGAFSSRLNANLRERHGWTYGARSGFSFGRGIGAFTISTSVEADRTADALAEIERELMGLAGDLPITDEEIEAARMSLLVALPGRWTTNADVMKALVERITHRLPDDHQVGTAARIRAVSPAQVRALAASLADPARFTTVVAGDPACLASGGFARLDADGECA